MKTRKEFLDYAKHMGMNHTNTWLMIFGIEKKLVGVEHLPSGFCGLKWNGVEWIEKELKFEEGDKKCGRCGFHWINERYTYPNCRGTEKWVE